MTTATDERLKIGMTLLNGATLIAAKDRHADEFVVLAMSPGSYEPYVTWVAGIDDDGDVITFWGHYFQDIAEAVRDFEGR